MKFNTIRIWKTLDDDTGEPTWVTSVTHDPAERVGNDMGPHYVGFYHCPESKPVAQGFEELRSLMVRNCLEVIQNATWNLEQLMRLRLEQDDGTR